MTEKEKLLQIIEAEKTSSFSLPQLSAEKTKWMENIQEYLKSLLEWISTFLPKDAKASITPEQLKILLYAFFIFVIVAFVVLIYFIIKEYRLKKKGHSAQRTIQQKIIETLENDLLKAKKNNDWGKASRILWKIHLKDQNLNLSITPLEASFLKRVDYTQYYPQMFSARSSETIFSKMENNLKVLS